MKTKFYQVNWSWHYQTDLILQKKFKGKSILNFPCGLSTLGYRADIDPKVKPDIIEDLFNHNFKTNSYDVVICDPPFSYYNKFKWLLKIKDIAKEYFVLSTPCICYTFKGFSEPEIYAHRIKGKLFLRFFFIYKNKKPTLS